MQSADELYCRLRGPAENVTVLATAFAPKQKGGTDENEPMLMTIGYGRGRVFSTLLGHAGQQLKSVAFIATFQRGAEWAATGNVTQKVPADFPGPDRPSIRQAAAAAPADPWVVYDGFDGPGKGKHIVLVSGDEEYRSEEALPQLGKILARRHGFKCTVLFAVDPATGTIDPNNRHNIPGLEALRTADLMILFMRFRDLPDEQMRHIVEYVDAGKPILGIRTATHAFNIPRRQDLRQIRLAEQGVGRRLRPANPGRNLGQPSRPPRPREHAGHHRARRQGASDRPRLRGHLGAHGRLHGAAAAARRQPAAGARARCSRA